jgi:hypothetical protein
MATKKNAATPTVSLVDLRDENGVDIDVFTLDPEQFGIKPTSAMMLAGELPRIKSERSLLKGQYDELLKRDPDDKDTVFLASQLRKRIRDNRTKGIMVWHETSKSYFLRGGQFVDAIKREEIKINLEMEEQLENIEKKAERLEQERINKLREDRAAIVDLYMDFIPTSVDLGLLDEEEFKRLRNGAELQYEARQAEIEAERKRAEAEAKRQEQRNSNFAKLGPYSLYIDGYDALDLYEMTSEEADEYLAIGQAMYELKQEELSAARQEAERVRKEAAEREAKLVSERKAAEDSARKDREAREKSEREAAERKALEDAKRQQELLEKQEADRKAQNAPDKEKLILFSNNLAKLERPDLSSQEAKLIMSSVNELIRKTNEYLNSKISAL